MKIPFQKNHVEDPFGKPLICCCLFCLADTRQWQDRDKTMGQSEREEKEEREREKKKEKGKSCKERSEKGQ